MLCLGEANLGDVMGSLHVQRLQRARELLAVAGYDTRDTRLACYGAAGFERGLAATFTDEKLLLIGPKELYAVPG